MNGSETVGPNGGQRSVNTNETIEDVIRKRPPLAALWQTL